MKIRTLCLPVLLAILPLTAAAQKPMAHMNNDAGMSPSSQAYMDGMNKMHAGMMSAMQEPDADKAFAKGMIEHHKGAIAMAETELRYGKSPEMRKMAQNIIQAQKAEIKQMQSWLNH